MFLRVLRVKMCLLWQTPKYVLGILTMVREYVRYLSFCGWWVTVIIRIKAKLSSTELAWQHFRVIQVVLS